MRYVSQTGRHLITRFKEHKDRSALLVAMHFADCNLMMEEEDVLILVSTNKSVTYLYIGGIVCLGTETLHKHSVEG